MFSSESFETFIQPLFKSSIKENPDASTIPLANEDHHFKQAILEHA
jgi:hypothetical protein